MTEQELSTRTFYNEDLYMGYKIPIMRMDQDRQ